MRSSPHHPQDPVHNRHHGGDRNDDEGPVQERAADHGLRPLAIDLFCGLGGWTEGLLAEGWRVVGFDIERHEYGDHRYPAQLVVQDVLTLHGSQFRNADLIVASPPCQEFSYMAMPWSRAKKIAAEYRSGKRDVKRLTALFDACFHIQREACEAAGRHIPLIVENVRGAQPWVGRARWNFGSFYLWGDVPALMPPTFRAQKNPGFRFDGSGRSFQTESVKNSGGSWFNIGSPGQKVTGQNPDGRKTKDHPNRRDGHPHTKHLTNPAEHGVKQGGNWFHDSSPGTLRSYSGSSGRKNPGIELGDTGFNVASARQFGHMVEGAKIERSADDKRQHIGIKRKFASAMIAKIPLTLSRHIAASYFPRKTEAA